MTLEIIGAGFGRTGTNSLKIALELIGYNPCYHMNEVRQNPSHVNFWNDVNSDICMDWRHFFKPYKAAVDWPVSAFAKQLHTIFKNSKIILTVRNPESWYESAKNTIFLGMANYERIEDQVTRNRLKMANSIIIDKIFSGKYDNKSHCIAVYQEHLTEIKKTIAPSDLLEFSVSDGWKPLCNFLNIDVPTVPFPYTNMRKDFFKNRPKYKFSPNRLSNQEHC